MTDIERPAFVTDEQLKFLAELHAAGNMEDDAAVAPYLEHRFGLTLIAAHEIIDYFWAMQTAGSFAQSARKPRSDRGRPRGRQGPNEGSLNHWLSSFAVGEVRYREFALDDPRAESTLRSLGSTTRYPDAMKGWVFMGRRSIAVPADDPLVPYVILKVERVR